MSTLRIFRASEPGFPETLSTLQGVLHGGALLADEIQLDVPALVRGILDSVGERGDEAVVELVNKLDGAELDPGSIRVSPAEIAAAHRAAEPEFLELMRRSVRNIRDYQEHILLESPEPLVRNGRRLGIRYTPIDRVAVYVPGGRAMYPSTVLMTVVPAQVAGVEQVAMFSPPTGGEISAMALALAAELGIDEVYRVGGAVAIGAAALGTATIPRVDKVVGPGNAFVAEAKRQLFGRVGIDSIAGPSEVLVIADDSANPAWVAADLLAQAEHNPGSALLVTPSASLAEEVSRQVEAQLETLSRASATRASLARYSAALVVEDLSAACDLANRFATEHLQLMTSDDERCLSQIRHAGAIFVGHHTPVPLGDYYAGPSHVLPTGGTAKFFGPLSCNDFLKSSSVVEYSEAALAKDAVDVADFASREGLTAHANAAAIRVR